MERGAPLDVARNPARRPEPDVIGGVAAHAPAGPGALEAAESTDVTAVLDGEVDVAEGGVAISAEPTDVDPSRGRPRSAPRRPRRPRECEPRRDLPVPRRAPDRGRSGENDTRTTPPRLRTTSPGTREHPLADCASALAHFERAVEIASDGASAWPMIGVMRQRIGDASPEPARSDRHARSLETTPQPTPMSHGDAMACLPMSAVHVARGDAEAARPPGRASRRRSRGWRRSPGRPARSNSIPSVRSGAGSASAGSGASNATPNPGDDGDERTCGAPSFLARRRAVAEPPRP